LAELLVVVTVITATLTVLFVQISGIFVNYTNKIYNYDTANALYAGYTMKKALSSEKLTNIINDENFITDGYLKMDLSTLNIDTFTSQPNNTTAADFYKTLVQSLGIREMYFTLYNPLSLQNSDNISSGLKNYLKTINLEDETSNNIYRIILVLKDGSYSTATIDLKNNI